MTSVYPQPCKAPNCRNTRANRRDLSFFRFPKEKERCFQWLQNSGLTELIGQKPFNLYNKYKLCAEHFDSESFMNSKSRNRLVVSAVPTIFSSGNEAPTLRVSNFVEENDTRVLVPDTDYLVDDPSSENENADNAADFSVFRVKTEPLDIVETETQSEDIVRSQTEPELIVKNEEDTITPHIEPSLLVETESTPNTDHEISKLKRLLEINNLKHEEKMKKMRFCLKRETSRAEMAENKVRKLTDELNEDVVEKYFSNLPENGKMFLKMQRRLNQGKEAKGGKTYTPAEKRTCLELYYLGPRSYEALGEMFFLPKTRTLRRWLKKVPVEPGIHSQLQRLLGETPEDTSEEVSVLSFDETSVDELLP